MLIHRGYSGLDQRCNTHETDYQKLPYDPFGVFMWRFRNSLAEETQVNQKGRAADPQFMVFMHATHIKMFECLIILPDELHAFWIFTTFNNANNRAKSYSYTRNITNDLFKNKMSKKFYITKEDADWTQNERNLCISANLLQRTYIGHTANVYHTDQSHAEQELKFIRNGVFIFNAARMLTSLEITEISWYKNCFTNSS